jgi:hypothetical protein
MLMLPLVPLSDSHVFEPPDLWQTRIDAAFRDRAPRIEPIDGADQIAVKADQILSGPHLERRRLVRGPRDDLRPGRFSRT